MALIVLKDCGQGDTGEAGHVAQEPDIVHL